MQTNNRKSHESPLEGSDGVGGGEKSNGNNTTVREKGRKAKERRERERDHKPVLCIMSVMATKTSEMMGIKKDCTVSCLPGAGSSGGKLV